MRRVRAIKAVIRTATKAVEQLSPLLQGEGDELPTAAVDAVLDLDIALVGLRRTPPLSLKTWKFGSSLVLVANDYGALEVLGSGVTREQRRDGYSGTDEQELTVQSPSGGVRCEIRIVRNLNGRMPMADVDTLLAFDRNADWIEENVANPETGRWRPR